LILRAAASSGGLDDIVESMRRTADSIPAEIKGSNLDRCIALLSTMKSDLVLRMSSNDNLRSGIFKYVDRSAISPFTIVFLPLRHLGEEEMLKTLIFSTGGSS